jgi:glutaredoxin-related protein
MGNSEEVFRQKYLPQHIRTEVMPILFGPEAAGQNEKLYKMLRRATTRRDEHALLYPTVNDMEDLKKRYDMQERQKEYDRLRDEKGGEHPDTKRAYAQLANLRTDLRKLLVERDRRQYFDEVDKRRALG